jgi:hypothetical protein
MCLANWLLSKHVVFAEVPALSADILKYYSMKKVITADDWLYRRLFNAVFQIIQHTDDEDGKRKEDEAAMKMTEQIRSQEEDLMNRINEQNEETRNALLEEFK